MRGNRSRARAALALIIAGLTLTITAPARLALSAPESGDQSCSTEQVVGQHQDRGMESDPDWAQSLAGTILEHLRRSLEDAFPGMHLLASPDDRDSLQNGGDVLPCVPAASADSGGAASSSVDSASSGSTSVTPGAAVPASDLQAQESIFRLCSVPDPVTERAIEQFVAGHSYSATLVSRPADACPSLTIRVIPRAGAAPLTGRQSTSLSVSSSSSGVQSMGRISVQIVTENGRTRATIASGS